MARGTWHVVDIHELFRSRNECAALRISYRPDQSCSDSTVRISLSFCFFFYMQRPPTVVFLRPLQPGVCMAAGRVDAHRQVLPRAPYIPVGSVHFTSCILCCSPGGKLPGSVNASEALVQEGRATKCRPPAPSPAPATLVGGRLHRCMYESPVALTASPEDHRKVFKSVHNPHMEA